MYGLKRVPFKVLNNMFCHYFLIIFDMALSCNNILQVKNSWVERINNLSSACEIYYIFCFRKGDNCIIIDDCIPAFYENF